MNLKSRVLRHAICLCFFFCLIPRSFVCAADKGTVDSLLSQIPSRSWPQAPELASTSAILVELNTDTILYAKNATTTMYPASTTKLMTAYLTLENAALDDIVTFSSRAVLSLEPGSSHIGLRPGEALTVEDALYGLLLPSANEAANGLAEYVSGSISSFAQLMNQTASELGCVNTHFTNANGLHDPSHSTCAYDLYLIMKACITQPDFVRISSSRTYVHYPDAVNEKEIPMATSNQLIKPSSEYYDETVICGKTGWTEQSGRCLVTYARRGDLDLIAVVMNSESPNQYLDTEKLLNYASDHFSSVRPSDLDTQYSTDLLKSDFPVGIPQTALSLLELDSSSRILLPDTYAFEDLTRHFEDNENTRTIEYLAEDYSLGSVALITPQAQDARGLWDSSLSEGSILSAVTSESIITIPVWIAAAILAGLLFILLMIRIALKQKQKRRRNRRSTPRYHMV